MIEFNDITAWFGIYAGTFIFCFLSGFIPIFNAEAWLVAVSAVSPLHVAIPLIVLSSLGQMSAKILVFLAGRGGRKLPLGKYEGKIEQAREKFERWKGKNDLLIFISAFTGFPPFYIISFLAGVLEFHLLRFAVAGLAGRLLRFGVVVYSPQLLKLWL